MFVEVISDKLTQVSRMVVCQPLTVMIIIFYNEDSKYSVNNYN